MTPSLNPWPDPDPQWMNWVSRAVTEAECLNKSYGRYGCRLPESNQILGLNFDVKWMYDESDCQCKGGLPTSVYMWRPGVWVTGTPRPLTWMTPLERNLYEWRNVTSFFKLENWILNTFSEERVLEKVKSQILCEQNIVTNSLVTLVCDCLSADSTKGKYFSNMDTMVS